MEAVDKLTTHVTVAVGWMSLATFARDILGSKSRHPGRAGRDWCKSCGVKYHRIGKSNWVKVSDLKTFFDQQTPVNDVRVPKMSAWR